MNNRPLLLALTSLGFLACHGQHDVAPVPPPWLDPKVDEQGRTASSNGEKVGDFYRGVALRDDDKTDWTMPLDPSHCYWFSGVGEQSVREISLYLWNPNDHRVVDKKSGTPFAIMTFCPEVPGMYRLQAKVAKGWGHYSVAIYATAPLAKAPAVAPPSADLEAIIDDQARAAAPGSKRVGEFFDGHADQTEWYANLNAGKCYWIIGAGEPHKVKKLWLYLWDPQNHRVTESKADTSTVMVGHCATQSGMFKFQAKVDSGSGNYKVAVYEKTN